MTIFVGDGGALIYRWIPEANLNIFLQSKQLIFTLQANNWNVKACAFLLASRDSRGALQKHVKHP